MPAGVPLTDAPGTREPVRALGWLHRDGFARVTLDTTGHADAPAPAGYRLWPADAPLPPRYTAIAGGVLIGRRITLDPEGGSDDPAGAGPSGTRAAALNLECARMLAGLLRTAGAEVTLTRRGDLALSDVERVQASEATHPDRLLRIAHRAEPPHLGYYFSSAGGKRWAEHLGQELARAGGAAPAAVEDAHYVLQQSSCVALLASPARVDRDESRLLAPGGLRAEAYAMFLALAREWAPDSVWAADSVEIHGGDERPLAGVPVRIGGLLFESDASGRVRFARTEPGPLEIEIADGASVRRRVLLDFEHGVVLTGLLER
jgi:N-acetylmuramoyl-L-alanine amidase